MYIRRALCIYNWQNIWYNINNRTLERSCCGIWQICVYIYILCIFICVYKYIYIWIQTLWNLLCSSTHGRTQVESLSLASNRMCFQQSVYHRRESMLLGQSWPPEHNLLAGMQWSMILEQVWSWWTKKGSASEHRNLHILASEYLNMLASLHTAQESTCFHLC